MKCCVTTIDPNTCIAFGQNIYYAFCILAIAFKNSGDNRMCVRREKKQDGLNGLRCWRRIRGRGWRRRKGKAHKRTLSRIFTFQVPKYILERFCCLVSKNIIPV
jgi:hypothetical protein